MVTFQQETLYAVIQDMPSLIEAHYQEICLDKDKIALEPCWKRYAALEQENAFLFYTARADGELIGYATFFSSFHLHHAALRLVSNDVLFVKKERRTGRTGIKLIQFCEEQIAAKYGEGFVLTWSAKEGTTLADMLQRKQYKVQEIVLSKHF